MDNRKKIFLITLVLILAVVMCACQSEEKQDQPDADLNAELDSAEQIGQDLDKAIPAEELAIAAIHNAVDDSVIPIASYDYETDRLIRYNWHLDTGEVTDTGLVILSQLPVDFLNFNWDGGSYITVEDHDQQTKAGPGIYMVYKDRLNPGYKDYMIKDFPKPKDKSYYNYCVTLEPFAISNGSEDYQFDLTDLSLPGGQEDSYIISSFYFDGDYAYFLLYPVDWGIYEAIDEQLVVVKYDMEHGTYEANMIINNPKFTAPMPPLDRYVNSTGNTFLVCNFLDGLYEINGDTYTAKKLYDNNDFSLENIEENDRVWIESASYYNGYLLLTINQYRFADDGTSLHFIVLKDGEIIAQLHTEDTRYHLPSL